MSFRRCALTVVAAAIAVMLCGGMAPAQDLTNWIRPDGFVSPDLKAGQYSLRAGIGLDGSRQKTHRNWENESFSGLNDYRWTRDEWLLQSNLTYALTDQWVLLGSMTFRPGQKTDDDTQESYTESPPPIEFSDQMSRMRRDLDHGLSTSVTVAFKPQRLFEVYVSGRYSRTMEDGLTTGTSDAIDHTFYEGYSLFLGFNMAR